MVVVTVHGALDGESCGQLRHILWDLINQQGNRNVIVDLRDMTVENSADLELFVDASRRAGERGGHFTVSGPRDATAAALARAGLSEVLDVEPSGSRPLFVSGG